MTTLFKSLSRLATMAAIAGLLMATVTTNEADADYIPPFCTAGMNCVTDSCACSPGTHCDAYMDASYGNCITPELSDNLAVAFFLGAGGMIYGLRRRALRRLSPGLA